MQELHASFYVESFETQSHASFSAYSKSLFVSENITNKKKILILGIRNLYLTSEEIYKRLSTHFEKLHFLLHWVWCVLAIKNPELIQKCCKIKSITLEISDNLCHNAEWRARLTTLNIAYANQLPCFIHFWID